MQKPKMRTEEIDTRIWNIADMHKKSNMCDRLKSALRNLSGSTTAQRRVNKIGKHVQSSSIASRILPQFDWPPFTQTG